MKLLHLADLHIGKTVNQFSMIDDQRYILAKILKIIEEHQVEAVLIAGDVYDKAVPSVEAVMLLNDFLSELAQRKRKVFVISGNHDSAQRIGFGSEIMKMSNVFLSKPFDGLPEKVVLKDDEGMINIYMLPFVKPAVVKPFYPEEEINSYEDAISVVMKHTGIKKQERNILMAHQFIRGGKRCDSEDLSIGGIDEVSVENFEGFDYVALGHLHGAQQIGNSYVRYAGSPLKYSFSEVKHKKAALIVDVKEKGNIIFEEIPLEPKRDMQKISGTYMEITEKSFYRSMNTEDYMYILLKDEEDIPEAMGKLRSIYPNIMKLEYDNQRTRNIAEIEAEDEVERKTPLQLFEEFYEFQNHQELNEEQKKLLISLIDKIWEDRE